MSYQRMLSLVRSSLLQWSARRRHARQMAANENALRSVQWGRATSLCIIRWHSLVEPILFTGCAFNAAITSKLQIVRRTFACGRNVKVNIHIVST
jgi:hypothetical protein